MKKENILEHFAFQHAPFPMTEHNANKIIEWLDEALEAYGLDKYSSGYEQGRFDERMETNEKEALQDN